MPMSTNDSTCNNVLFNYIKIVFLYILHSLISLCLFLYFSDSPLFNGTQTDQNHTKQQKNVKFKKKGFAQLLLPHTTPTKYYKKKSSSPFPLSGNHFPSAEWFAPGCASTKLCYKRIVLVRVSIVNRRRLRNHT